MVTDLEKKYQRDFTQDRKNDLNINNEKINNRQSSPKESIKNIGESSLSESLKEVEVSQGTPEQSMNEMSGLKPKDLQRRLGKDRLQSKKDNIRNEKKEIQSTPEKILRTADSLSGSWQRLKANRQRLNNKKVRLKLKAGSTDKSKALAEKMANKAVRKAWMEVHEIVEEVLIGNFYLLPIFGPIYLLLLVARPFLAMLGMLNIKIKGVKVKLIPGYSLNSFFLRAKGAAAIALITALEWIVIIALIYVFTHPFSAAWGLLKALWEAR